MKIKIELDNDVRLVWPTPIFNRLYPNTSDMNARLLEIVHQKEREDKGTTKSIVSGWHSTEDVHTWHYPEVERLLGFISEAVTELTKLSTGATDEKMSANSTYIEQGNQIFNVIAKAPSFHNVLRTRCGSARCATLQLTEWPQMFLAGAEWTDMCSLECSQCQHERHARDRVIHDTQDPRLQQRPYDAAPCIHPNNLPKYCTLQQEPAAIIKTFHEWPLSQDW